MDQILTYIESLSIGPWFIVLGAVVMTTLIVIPVYVVEYVENKRKKPTAETTEKPVEEPKIATKSKIKAQLRTLDKAPKGKVTWL